MARFVLLLLLVVAGALVMALLSDHRGRRDARFDRLRQAFLHGQPLGGTARPVAVVEVVHPGGVRLRAPASWAIDLVERERPVAKAPAAGGRRVRVEVVRLEQCAAGSVVDALAALEPERSVELLANGHAFVKSVVPVRADGGWAASYAWRLARSEPGGGLRIAVFRLQLPVDSASDVIAQSDLATLEREVREATFSAGPSAIAG
jgi:hypothetical protein